MRKSDCETGSGPAIWACLCFGPSLLVLLILTLGVLKSIESTGFADDPVTPAPVEGKRKDRKHRHDEDVTPPAPLPPAPGPDVRPEPVHPKPKPQPDPNFNRVKPLPKPVKPDHVKPVKPDKPGLGLGLMIQRAMIFTLALLVCGGIGIGVLLMKVPSLWVMAKGWLGWK